MVNVLHVIELAHDFKVTFDKPRTILGKSEYMRFLKLYLERVFEYVIMLVVEVGYKTHCLMS